MVNHRRLGVTLSLLLAVFAVTWWVSPGQAYVEAPMSFGAIVAQSSNIVLMQVTAVDKTKNFIIYRKVQDIKGKHAGDVIKHNIGQGGLRANEWKPSMDWAEPGKMAVFFYNGGASETFIGKWWYQAYAGGEWWNHSHAEPFLLRSYCGPPEKLVGIIGQMLEGNEVVVPCMVDGNKEDLHNRKAKIQRIKVSLKIQDYNPKRDFVGWGGEDFRRIQGMAGFSHITSIARVDPEAQAISVADIDGDGKPDFCMVGAGRLVLLQNSGEALSEMTIPGGVGARAAVWADYNGDGLPDLLLATPAGLRLYTNLGKGQLRDDSQLLPAEPYASLTAAAWIDHDGDGKPDILLANGYHGLRLYRNRGVAPKDKEKAFIDVSTQVGLGEEGIVAGKKGDTLTVGDVNGDGRPDFLFGAETGILVLNAKNAKGEAIFNHAKDSGISYTPGKVGPVFGDFNGDGHADLFVPQRGKSKLYQGDGKGRFTDVTANSGDLANLDAWATSAAWGDLYNDGKLDLIVGCLKGPNRFFRNKGNGIFEDATEAVGLGQKVFNSQAVSLVDLNSDGRLDLICNNEGQDSVVLLGSTTLGGSCIPLAMNVIGKEGVVGSRVEVADKQGKVVGVQQISGGEGRGGQGAHIARFTLPAGTYRVQVRYTSGTVRAREVTLGADPVRGMLDETAPKTE